MDVRVGPGNRRAYKGSSSKDLKLECGYDFQDRAFGPIGTVPTLVLMSTITANGTTPNIQGLQKFFNNFQVVSDGAIVSYKVPKDMAMDGSIPMNIVNVSRDYFKTGTGSNSLQGDAELHYNYLVSVAPEEQKLLMGLNTPASQNEEYNPLDSFKNVDLAALGEEEKTEDNTLMIVAISVVAVVVVAGAAVIITCYCKNRKQKQIKKETQETI